MTARHRRIRELVEFLCSRACMGRRPGTPGSAAARARIVQEMRAASVLPGAGSGYAQTVPDCGTNVIGQVPGHGPLADRSVVVAAHYDHLGPTGDGDAYWGADDNAAAVAILLEVGRCLAGSPAEGSHRQVVLAAFDGEEPPHFAERTMGSMYWVRRPTVPLEGVDMMICMDLVGHAVGPPAFPDEVRRSVFVLGAELSVGTPALVDAVARSSAGVVPRRMSLDVIPPLSDYVAFVEAGVPALFLTCGRWEHYHRPTDTPDRLDYPKIEATADYLHALVEAMCTREDAPVVFDREGRDDLAAVQTLLEVGEQLEPHVPGIATVRPIAEGLRDAAARGRLSPRQRAELSMLVQSLEELLA